MSIVFGPVPSRRLGLSLGVDLVPPKTCSYDCLYCEAGKTLCKTLKRFPFVTVSQVMDELGRGLHARTPDTITLAGSGEPTLHSEIGEIIASIKKMTDVKVALLTNGSLFWAEEVRKGVLGADIIMPTLTSGKQGTFERIHRPHPGLSLKKIIEGLRDLRQIYSGQYLLEVFLLEGLNDSAEELETLRGLIQDIRPDRVQLNTVVRPPAHEGARPLDRDRLLHLKDFFGSTAEVIVDAQTRNVRRRAEDTLKGDLLNMMRRRPLRVPDIAHAMAFSMEEAERLVADLMERGTVCSRPVGEEVYYVVNEGYVS